MLSHTVTSPRTRVTMLLTAKTADIVAGTWSGTLSDHRMAATFRVDADGTATVRAKADELEAEGDPEDANKIARLRAAA